MFLLDSNVLIDCLEGKEEIRQFIEQIKTPVFISVISITELLAKPSLSKTQENFVEDFLQQFSVLEYSEGIAKEAAKLKKKYHLKFPDAIIAATAYIHKLTLVSRDKGFRKIREIETVNFS